MTNAYFETFTLADWFATTDSRLNAGFVGRFKRRLDIERAERIGVGVDDERGFRIGAFHGEQPVVVLRESVGAVDLISQRVKPYGASRVRNSTVARPFAGTFTSLVSSGLPLARSVTLRVASGVL